MEVGPGEAVVGREVVQQCVCLPRPHCAVVLSELQSKVELKVGRRVSSYLLPATSRLLLLLVMEAYKGGSIEQLSRCVYVSALHVCICAYVHVYVRGKEEDKICVYFVHVIFLV
mmetsp:Transcript_47098/g.121716  ORF Transcript_47098/g.121716 Transcript_47098/m.121716 type:complete len:114 (-) Transcript_47098:27-368(-)